ncbi:MAG: hypothetical protein J6Y98_01720 [Bacteroidales bacterium]|nr:hypothetical protein [Bacteroidales bacterium]
MSAIISVGLLVKRCEDAEKMAARAKELIEKTVPEEMKPYIELDFLEANMENPLWYNRHWCIGIAGVRKGCAEKAIEIMDDVVATFPDIQMRYYQTYEGPLDFEGVSKNGQLEMIEPWTFVVHVADDDSYRQLHTLLTTKDLLLDFWPERHSIGWRYDKNTEEEQSNLLLEELSRKMVDKELMSYRYDDRMVDVGIKEYARARNGHIEWFRTDAERIELMEGLMLYSAACNNLLTTETILFSSDEKFKKLSAEAYRIYEQEEEEYRKRTAQKQTPKQDSENDDFPF